MNLMRQAKIRVLKEVLTLLLTIGLTMIILIEKEKIYLIFLLLITMGINIISIRNAIRHYRITKNMYKD